MAQAQAFRASALWPQSRSRENESRPHELRHDRLVHHSVILEFDVPRYRTNAAQQQGQTEEVNRQN